ncbi:glycoside hydrolase family 172 protein [uncultured Paludibaculum sp.]|uniref:glycoside hydrolase family 172 protein n=1 Tax=uncultured Paludibaculum sp. TaxID=1765020 RepID=UPI002AABCE71|nr:glycoside hydrolase family 172 protein [uncultured Paludibaculum sp.]
MKTLAAFLIAVSFTSPAQELYRKQPDSHTRWATFENPLAAKGQAATENKGAKGRPFEPLAAGETKALLNVQGSGSVRRIWITISDRDPATLRALKLEMFWDGAKTPAVSVPFGDFFGAIHGRAVKLENELFANPEGRSFNCYIPMPFRTAARITLTNESGHNVKHLFYDVDILTTAKPDPDALYFHAIWRRERPTELGRDFEILPLVKGDGRFLGTHVGVIAAPDVTGWWGEGEVKMFMDGDTTQPTIAGTGTEDYIGTGWGQGLFQTRFMGSTVGDKETRQYAFYRYHIPDPVYFHRSLRVTLQQMGGDNKANVLKMLERGVTVKPVSIDVSGQLVPLLTKPAGYNLATDPAPGDSWVNMYQRQDVSAVAFFYLDAPENGLPRLAPATERTAALPVAAPTK